MRSLTQRTHQRLNLAGDRVLQLERRLTTQHPRRRLPERMQRLDELESRLGRAISRTMQAETNRLDTLAARLHRQAATVPTPQSARQVATLSERLEAAAHMRLSHAGLRLSTAEKMLHSLSPTAVLQRGYAIVSTDDGHILTDAALAVPDSEIRARLARGELRAKVVDRNVDSA